MLFRPGTHIELTPDFGALDETLVVLTRAFLDLEFETEACARFVESAVADGDVSERFVDLSALRAGGLVMRPEALFPEVTGWRFCLAGSSASDALDITVGSENFKTLAELLRIATHGQTVAALRDRLSEEKWRLFAPFLADDTHASDPDEPDMPGLYRREHASLLIRSTTTSVLVDPARLFSGGRFRGALAPLPRPNAVLISHGHDDHWHFASLLDAVKDSSVPVIVPDVPRRSLLSRSVFSEELKLANQAVDVRAWGAHLEVGDISVEVLPFYGEQPSRDAPGAAAGLRSWGNCYLVRTPQLSALVLVDSGADPDGDMRDVVADAVRRTGPVDVVLSCLREFPSPFFGGLEVYWAALPFSRLQQLYANYKEGTLPFTTTGPEGAAELCAIAGARWFLPYAHGYEGGGVPITDIGWGMDGISEAEILQRVRVSARGGLAALAWNPGDVAVFRGGSLEIVPRAEGDR
jgi:L-ascorbate metabolism protein UlaG (beta-lactamase superfamily)